MDAHAPGDEDTHRARAYMLLAATLARPPEAALLARFAALGGDDTPLGRALGAVGAAAASTTPVAVEREFNRLFIGVERGELVPYASFYRTGFLQDRPLIEVRAAMARLGIVRARDAAEPEDHIASLAEIMAGLIDGRFGASAAEQFRFFDDHIQPWAPRFFGDLQRASASVFYRPIGAFGCLFLNIEENAFALAGA